MSTVDSSAAFDQALAGLGISRYGVAGDTEVKTAAQAQTLGQKDFLALLTAQLNNQDPFDPVKNEDMVAQMATFSTNAGISEMNTTLKSLAAQMQAQVAGQALGYVGKTVLVKGDTAYPQTGGGFAASVDLGADASAVEVTISGSDGNVLRTLSLGPQAAGQVDFDWDGKDEAGNTVDGGPFKVAARAVTADGGVAVPVLVWAPVTSVTMGSDAQAPMLNIVGLGQQPLTAVREVG